MTYQAEAAAIRTRFSTEWDDTTPIAWPNVNFTPPNPPSAWVRFTILPATASQSEIGANPLYRHTGFVVIQVFTPDNAGPGEAEQLAEQACGIFRGVTAGGIRYQGPRNEAPVVQTIGNDGNGWYQVNARISYTRDSTF